MHRNKEVGRLGPGELRDVTVKDEGALEIPLDIAASPRLRAIWEGLVGDGSAFRESDAPSIKRWVENVDIAEQALESMRREDGSLELLVNDGPMPRKNPLLDVYWKASDMALKHAKEYGGTPYARAKMGFAQAATDNLEVGIAEKMRGIMRADAKRREIEAENVRIS